MSGSISPFLVGPGTPPPIILPLSSLGAEQDIRDAKQREHGDKVKQAKSKKKRSRNKQK